MKTFRNRSIFTIYKCGPAGVEYHTSMVPAINNIVKSVDLAGVEYNT